MSRGSATDGRHANVACQALHAGIPRDQEPLPHQQHESEKQHRQLQHVCGGLRPPGAQQRRQQVLQRGLRGKEGVRWEAARR
jgi:hypothetical protein